MSKASRVVIPVLAGLEQNDKPFVKKVVKGVRQVSHQTISADSHGSSSCSFSFQPPSQNTVIDRRIMLNAEIQIDRGDADGTKKWNKSEAATANNVVQTFLFRKGNTRVNLAADAAASTIALVNGGPRALMGNNLAPRQFPLAQLMDTIDLTINGTHFTSSVNQYISAVMKYTTPEYREKVFGSCGYHHPDTDALYKLSAGSEDHPLNLAQEGGRHGEVARGAKFGRDVEIVKSVAGSQDDGGLKHTLNEPLFLSPLMMEYGHGMTNINDISVTINWKSNLTLAYSLATYDGTQQAARTNPLTTFVASFPSAPTLSVRYYTPQSDVKIPNEIVLPYKQPKIVVNPAETYNAAAVVSQGSNIRLNQIPEACYLYCVRQRSGVEITDANVFTRPEKVNINWGNQTGILSGAKELDLLEIAMGNGCDTNCEEYIRSGYALKLEFGKDIPLDDNESPGTRGDYNWQVEFTSKKPTGEANGKKFEFFQVFIYNGHAVISPNECRVQTGLLDLKDNVEATEMGHEHGGSVVGGSEVGGSLLGDVGKHLLKHVAGKSKMGKAAAEMIPCAEKAFEAYKTRA